MWLIPIAGDALLIIEEWPFDWAVILPFGFLKGIFGSLSLGYYYFLKGLWIGLIVFVNAFSVLCAELLILRALLTSLGIKVEEAISGAVYALSAIEEGSFLRAGGFTIILGVFELFLDTFNIGCIPGSIGVGVVIPNASMSLIAQHFPLCASCALFFVQVEDTLGLFALNTLLSVVEGSFRWALLGILTVGKG